jgi:hypothetical protein
MGEAFWPHPRARVVAQSNIPFSKTILGKKFYYGAANIPQFEIRGRAIHFVSQGFPPQVTFGPVVASKAKNASVP